MTSNSSTYLQKIAFIGNYIPRQCGIATFTTDLCEAVAAQFPDGEVFSLAMNDQPEGYAYPERVRFEIPQDDLAMYCAAADYLNLNQVDVVCLQHEFGIFGGKAGSHVLTLLRNLRAPVVTTLHTVPSNPTPEQRQVMDELTRLSACLVVMSERGKVILEDIYATPAENIDLIHHGIPGVPFVDANFFKDKFEVGGKQVLLTFGLLSANKGIEYVIQALPEIVAQYPDVVYLVLGATHPNILRNEGERYRASLENLAQELGVAEHVLFFNQYVSLEELIEFIGATDIYITPYLNPDQIVSGTLAYTVGAGKAVISTPYIYSTELLSEGRGWIIPFHDSEAIAKQVLHVLNDETERHATRKRAYLFGRKMIWPQISRQYLASFERSMQARFRTPALAESFLSPILSRSQHTPVPLPRLNLDHLFRLTDHTGIIQHAVSHIPNFAEGYSSDDNARALILTMRLEELLSGQMDEIAELFDRYLAFLKYAFNPGNQRFRNFLGYDRNWLEEAGSEDSHARSLWSLGCVIGRSSDENRQRLAYDLFKPALPVALTFTSPRSWAFTLLGISDYLRRFHGDRSVANSGAILCEKLLASYRQVYSPEWEWCEEILTYNNATLPHALLLSSQFLNRPDVEQIALQSLLWLDGIQTSQEGHFSPVGSLGFYQRDGEMARFDQQPIEASAMISACLDAYQITCDQHWIDKAHQVFAWFLGKNDLGLPVYDSKTGGCRDGIHPQRLNTNQGAESTLAFLLSLVELYLLDPSALITSHITRILPFAHSASPTKLHH